jgi:murein DD-endopeptidase MepM/ murein hydrolase activator NlpD
MMHSMHSHRSGRSLALAPRGAAILFAALASGCSAEISRFDFPSFSLTDDKKDQTSSLQQPSGSSRGPSYLGNDGRSAASDPQGGGYERGGYTAPRPYRESGVATADLSEPSRPAPNFNYADERRRRAGQQPQPATAALRPGESVEVRPGETLYALSRRHHVPVAELMEVNQLSNPNLHPGQRIYLPDGYAVQPTPPPAATASVRPPVNIPPADLSKYQGTHTVREGESLYAISKSYGVKAAELQQANGITDPRSVRAGAVLKVPGTGDSTAVAAAEPAATLEPAAEAPARVADAPVVVQTTREPTVINRRETQVASRDSEVSTGAINPAPERQRSSSDKLRWPVHGRILTGFGQRSDGTHNDGINLSVPQGTSVHAAENGTVAYAGSELKGYGNLILVRHDNGWVTAYAHNDELMVKRGDKVQRGQVIAKAGRSGAVDQPQVHFELRQGSKPVDPVPFLEQL